MTPPHPRWQPPSHPDSAPRPLPSVVAIAICSYLQRVDGLYKVASLLREHQIQAVILLDLSMSPLLFWPAKRPFHFFHRLMNSTEVLEFFRLHLPSDQLKKLIDQGVMDDTVSMEALQWWKESGLELRYTSAAMQQRSIGELHVLQWWKDSGLELKYDELAMNWASSQGHVAVLQWWKDSGLELKYDAEAVYHASENGLPHVLQWWKDSGLEFRYDARAMDGASRNGQTQVLQWWKDSGYVLQYTSHGIKGAVVSAEVKCLQWWRNSGLDVDWAAVRLEDAWYVTVLDWWLESGLFAKWLNNYSDKREALERFVLRANSAAKEWWQDRLVEFEEPCT